MCKFSITTSCGYISDNLHVLILVPGTTDPFNIADDNNSEKCATKAYWTMRNKEGISGFLKATSKEGKQYDDPFPNSYQISSHNFSKEFPDPYMKTYNGADFIEALQTFDSLHSTLKLEVSLEWSGNNTIRDRKLAGEKLINILLDENNYHADRRDKPMYIHLIGHSHGGMVINEFANQISKNDSFPEHWKIKSVIYLSTPFFNNLHKIEVTEKAFYKDAKILNVYDEYDLTQRVIADFSLESFFYALKYLKKTIAEHLDNNWKDSQREKDFKELGKIANYSIVNFNWSNGVAHLASLEYSDGIDVFNALSSIFDHIGDLFGALPEIIDFIANEPINDEGKTVIPKEVAAQINKAFAKLQAEAKTNAKALIARRDKYQKQTEKVKYISLTALLEDLKFDALINLFNIDPNTLETQSEDNVWSFLVKILTHNIEAYDNTLSDPSVFFKGTFLESNVEQSNVTDQDPYIKTPNHSNFNNFIKRLEDLEDAYGNNDKITKDKDKTQEEIIQAEKNKEHIILDMLLTMIANMEIVKTIAYFVPFLSPVLSVVLPYSLPEGNIDSYRKLKDTIGKLQIFFDNFRQLIADRNFKLVNSATDYIDNPFYKLGEFSAKTNPFLLYYKYKYREQIKESELLEQAIKDCDPIVYFSFYSHSVSRHMLFPEVLEFLKKATDYNSPTERIYHPNDVNLNNFFNHFYR